MNREHTQLIKIFYSYAHKDEGMRDELDNHVGRDGVTAWHDRKITAGTEWLIEINRNLANADIILLLISANYLSSVSCNEEMRRALAQRSGGEAIVIPVILSSVASERLAPLRDLQFLPTDGKPVENWPVRNQAFANIADSIHKKIKEILSDVNFFVNKGDALSKRQDYENAISAYNKVLDINSEHASTYEKKGEIFYELRRYLEAAESFQQAIEHGERNVQLLRNRARALTKSRRLREAYTTLREAIQLAEENPYLYKELGDILFELKEIPQAIAEYTKAIQYNEKFVLAYRVRIRACEELARDDRKRVDE